MTAGAHPVQWARWLAIEAENGMPQIPTRVMCGLSGARIPVMAPRDPFSFDLAPPVPLPVPPADPSLPAVPLSVPPADPALPSVPLPVPDLLPVPVRRVKVAPPCPVVPLPGTLANSSNAHEYYAHRGFDKNRWEAWRKRTDGEAEWTTDIRKGPGEATDPPFAFWPDGYSCQVPRLCNEDIDRRHKGVAPAKVAPVDGDGRRGRGAGAGESRQDAASTEAVAGERRQAEARRGIIAITPTAATT